MASELQSSQRLRIWKLSDLSRNSMYGVGGEGGGGVVGSSEIGESGKLLALLDNMLQHRNRHARIKLVC